MYLGLHVGPVTLPFSPCWAIIEGIGITVDIRILKFSEDDTPDHPFQLKVAIDKSDIRPYLGTGVALPHCSNIARVDKGVIFTVFHAIMDCRLKSVGKAVLKHPGQARIVFQNLLHPLYLLVYGLRLKESLMDWRTLTDECRGIFGHGVRVTLCHLTESRRCRHCY